jgi:hypothetical protein
LLPFLDFIAIFLQVSYNIKQIKAAFIYFLGALVYFGNNGAVIYSLLLPDLIPLVFGAGIVFRRNQGK